MFLLRCGSREIPLPEGGCLIGRGGDCQVIVDDGLASRRHAFLKISADRVTVQDLGSRNGVYVNGSRVVGSVPLEVGDNLIIGQTQFVLGEGMGVPPPRPSLRPSRAAGPHPVPEPREDTGGKLDVTAHAELLTLLGTVADKCIAQGRPEQAERLLTRHLNQLMQAAKGSRLTDAKELELAAANALKLASATGKGEWVEYIFELYGCARQLLPAPIIDGLYEAVRKAPPSQLSCVQRYLDQHRERAGAMNPADRFLLQRLEGLARVAMSG
jgi:hypothetical protein